MSDKILITAEGKKKFEDELRYLKNEATDQNRKEIAAAREQGDLSENADYDAAKDKETEIAARINKLQYILDNCEVIVADGNSRKKDNKKKKKKVTIKDLSDDSVDTYMIVSTVEANVDENKISNICALGAALIGKPVGDIVKVKVDEPYEVQILAIE